jgi:hypothetical protein
VQRSGPRSRPAIAKRLTLTPALRLYVLVAGSHPTTMPSNTFELSGELSIGDVIEIETGSRNQWLACDPSTWRPIAEHPTCPASRCPRPPCTSTWPTNHPPRERLGSGGAAPTTESGPVTAASAPATDAPTSRAEPTACRDEPTRPRHPDRPPPGDDTRRPTAPGPVPCTNGFPGGSRAYPNLEGVSTP